MAKIINYAQELKDLKTVIDKIQVLVLKNPNNALIRSLFNQLLKRQKKLCENKQ
jgi:hypothetical protein